MKGIDILLSIVCLYLVFRLMHEAIKYYGKFKSVQRKKFWTDVILILIFGNIVGVIDMFVPLYSINMVYKGLTLWLSYVCIMYLRSQYKPMVATNFAENDFENAAHFNWDEYLNLLESLGGTHTAFGVQVNLNKQTKERAELTYNVLEDTKNFPWHFHKNIVEHWTIEGEPIYTQDPVTKGEMQLIHSGQVHNFFAKKGTIVKVIVHKI